MHCIKKEGLASFVNTHYNLALYTDYLTKTPKETKLHTKDLVLTVAKTTEHLDQSVLEKAKVLAKILKFEDPNELEDVRKIEELKNLLVFLDHTMRDSWEEHLEKLMHFAVLKQRVNIRSQIETVYRILNDLIGPQENRMKITDLPPEVLTKLFTFCSKDTVGALTRTCRQFHAITNNDYFKQEFFACDPKINFLIQTPTSLREILQFETKIQYYRTRPLVSTDESEAMVSNCKVRGQFLTWRQMRNVLLYKKIDDENKICTIDFDALNCCIDGNTIYTLSYDSTLSEITVKTSDIETQEKKSSIELPCKVSYHPDLRYILNWHIHADTLAVETPLGCQLWNLTNGVLLYKHEVDGLADGTTTSFQFYDDQILMYSSDQNVTMLYPNLTTLENTKGYVPVLQRGNLVFFRTPLQNISIFDMNTHKQMKLLVISKNTIDNESKFALIGDVLFWTYHRYNIPSTIYSYNIRREKFEIKIQDIEQTSRYLESFNDTLIYKTTSGISMIEFQTDPPGIVAQVESLWKGFISFITNL